MSGKRTLLAMSAVTLDRWLALLVIGLATTGLVSLRMGRPDDGWLFAVHGLLAGALALAASAKVARSLPKAVRARRWGRAALGLGLSTVVAAALVGGFAWVVSGRLLTIGSWTVLTVHAWVGLILVPVVAVHLLPRRWRLLVPRDRSGQRSGQGGQHSRRAFLAAAFTTIGGVAVFGAAQLLDRVAGGTRRFTGSRWLPGGGIPPPTTFYGEGPPSIDAGSWRLRVRGRVAHPMVLTLNELTAIGKGELSAVLDCTSGWAIETTWQGTPLGSILATATIDPSARSIVIRSQTGYAAVLNPAEAARALLATSVAGGSLPAANGAPCRLVVPDQRGLDWVKWVEEIEVI